jgi:GT2 family glycosyltransferase
MRTEARALHSVDTDVQEDAAADSASTAQTGVDGAAPRVSVVIVTWNVRDLTLQCIRALHARADGVPLEIIVVDNASSDGTADAVRVAFPGTIVIANDTNVGFPRANNQALREARGDCILFLNPDTLIGEGTLRACVETLDEDASVGMVGCRLLYENGEVQPECARRPYLLRHLMMETLYLHMLFPRHRLFGHHLIGDWDHLGTRDVEAISGAFMMVRRDVAVALGGLPEELFMYHEDLSFCLRLRRAGWKIRYRGDHTTMHYWRRSTNRSTMPLELLEGEHKLLLIREAQGPAASAVGRGVFVLRSAIRLAIAGAASMLPDDAPVKRRHPRVFDARRHALHLAWSLAPGTMRRLVPPPSGAPVPFTNAQ